MKLGRWMAVLGLVACGGLRLDYMEDTFPSEIHAEVLAGAHASMAEAIEDLSHAPPPMDDGSV